jgi:DNA-binding winged helix-turn-helix (wHTH) protein
MTQQKYLINGRFKVDEVFNLLTDTTANSETRLEPRLMKLLSLLAKNQGTVVTREYLIKEILDNYGGAEEGLNQAISTLRKILDDRKKEIIKTVPSKGYILTASVSEEMPEIRTLGVKAETIITNNDHVERNWFFNKRSIWVLLLALLLAGLSYSIYVYTKSPEKGPEEVNPENSEEKSSQPESAGTDSLSREKSSPEK